MAIPANKYLKKRGEVWWFQRRVPAQLKHKFPNQTLISESLGTGDLREARRQRDVVNGRLQEQKSVAPSSDRYRFYELIRTLSEDKIAHPYSWDEPYDYDKLAKTDETFLHALTTVSGHKDQSIRYRITLNEALSLWVQQHQQSKTKDTVSKIKRAASDFLNYLSLIDIQLAEIGKRQVHDYINQMQKTYAKTTVQGNISRLRSIWNYCDRIGEVSGASPFDGHVYAGGNTVQKKQPFTTTELEWIKANVATDEPVKRLLLELGVFTGCRISELCSIRCKDVIIDDEITAIFIEQGKTNAATRTIPLTNQLGNQVRSLAATKEPEALLLGVKTKDMSRWFSRIKTENISTDSTKCFHSFRVMFSTAMQQAGVDELKAAAILGHKRGNTMTYGYYSRGYDLQQLKDAYDQCVERINW
jgi:integrase